MGTRRFLLWREDDATHVRGKIVAAELSADGLSFHGKPKRTLMVGQYPWEDGSSQTTAAATSGPGRKLPPGAGPDPLGIGPIENPAMARDPDTGAWLLTWSANNWSTIAYATGLAVCKGPLGPCDRHSRDRPWLGTSNDPSISTSAVFAGAGGLSFVTGPDKHLYAVFHAYRANKATNATRIGWAYRVKVVDGKYRLVEF
jgi:hypothetical protein